jgi:hypothetical protein
MIPMTASCPSAPAPSGMPDSCMKLTSSAIQLAQFSLLGLPPREPIDGGVWGRALGVVSGSWSSGASCVRSKVSRSNIPEMSNSAPLMRTLYFLYAIVPRPANVPDRQSKIASGSPTQCSQNQDGMATFSSASSLGPSRSVTSCQKLTHRASTRPALQKRTMWSVASFLVQLSCC